MNTVNHLIITNSILTSYPSELYFYYTIMRNQTDVSITTLEKDNTHTYLRIDNSLKLTSRCKMGMGRQAFNEHYNKLPIEQYLDNEVLILMPHQVWDQLFDFVSQFSMKARNSWIKLYLYVYYGYCRAKGLNKGYFLSIEDAAARLHMDHSDVSSKLIALEAAHFLKRGGFSSILGLSKTLLIPDELLFDTKKDADQSF